MTISDFLDDKKPSVYHEEDASMSTQDDDAHFLATYPEEKRRKVLRKIDLRLIPVLLLLYLVTYIDKANIGNAKIEGMLPSLGMSGIQYNIALSIFFIPYVIFEVPSNILLKKFKRPSRYLALLVFTWGVCMISSGCVTNFAGLTALRFLLGLFEAGFFPGAILMISEWYLPHETQTRVALSYSSAASGGAFSGLLAFGIAKMNGLGGYEGWRWIFIMEGVGTVIMAGVCYFCLIDTPSLSTKWLDAEEIRYLELRQQARRVVGASKRRGFDWKALWTVLKDWKIILLFFANWSQSVPNYALKFAMPQIIKNMGFTSANAQLLTIPPYACGAIAAYVFATFSDRCKWRMPFIIGPQILLVIAFAILYAKAGDIKDSIGVNYFALCLSTTGMCPILPGVTAWNVANLQNPVQRGMGIAYLIAMGNIGGLIGSYIYLDAEAPRYPTGYGTSFGFAAAGIIAVLTLEYLLWNINKRRSKMTAEEIHSRYTDEQLKELADRSPLFRYAL